MWVSLYYFVANTNLFKINLWSASFLQVSWNANKLNVFQFLLHFSILHLVTSTTCIFHLQLSGPLYGLLDCRLFQHQQHQQHQQYQQQPQPINKRPCMFCFVLIYASLYLLKIINHSLNNWMLCFVLFFFSCTLHSFYVTDHKNCRHILFVGHIPLMTS